MRGILITQHGEIGTAGAAISVPCLLWCCCFNVTHFYDFLRHFASDCDPGPPQVWSLHWCYGLSSIFSQSQTGFYHYWPMRSSHSPSPQLSDVRQFYVWQWRAWQRSGLQPGQNTINVTNKTAQTTENKWQSIIFYLLHISYKLSHLFNSHCETPAGRRLRVTDNCEWPGQWSGDTLTLWPAVSVSNDDFKINASPSVRVPDIPGSPRHIPTQRKQLREESSMKILWVASSMLGSRRNMLKRQNWIVSDSLHLPLKDFMNDKCSFLWTLNFVFPLIYLGNNPVCGIDDWCVGVERLLGCGGNVSNVISIDYFPDQAQNLLQSLQIIRLLQIYEAASPPRVHCNLINVTAEVHKHRKRGGRVIWLQQWQNRHTEECVTSRVRDPWHGESPGVTMSRDTSHTS